MFLINKLPAYDESTGFLGTVKQKARSLREAIGGLVAGSETEHETSAQEIEDRVDDVLGRSNSLLNSFSDDIASYAHDLRDYEQKYFGGGGFRSEVDDFLMRGFSSTWTSTTYAVPNTTRQKKPIRGYTLEKIKQTARKDWRQALLDALLVKELCILFNHDEQQIDKADSDVLREACLLIGIPECEFPLDKTELEDAVSLRNITMLYLTRSFIPDSEWKDVSEYSAKLDAFAQQADDLCRIWAYASRKFCGAEHLVPVAKLSDLISARDEQTFGSMDELAKATGADILLEAYFSGVPADDIIA